VNSGFRRQGTVHSPAFDSGRGALRLQESRFSKEASMLARLALLGFVAVLLPGFAGVYGAKGNDTGGIIPWSREAEAMAMITANNNCSMYGKYARITSIRRVYGDYIVYECRFDRRRPNKTYEAVWGRTRW
jgi:hypothetical protein